MIILDIETSGLDPRKSSLLSIGAIDFDNPDDSFYGECQVFQGAEINPKSLEITGFTNEQITDSKKTTTTNLLRNFLNWLSEKKDQTIAGQNVHWDVEFLRQELNRSKIDYKLGHRIVDLHSVAYAKLLEQKKEIPLRNNRTDLDLDRILQICGLQSRNGSHNALEDCRLTEQCFRKLLNYRIGWQ